MDRKGVAAVMNNATASTFRIQSSHSDDTDLRHGRGMTTMTTNTDHAARRRHGRWAVPKRMSPFRRAGAVARHDPFHYDYEDDFIIRSSSLSRSPDGLWAEEDAKRQPHFLCWGFSLSLLTCTVLLALSGIKATWTLNEGESRKIEAPILSSQIVVSSSHIGNARLDAVVYNVPECPPLTGEPVVVESAENVTLEQDQFLFDYYFLNAGSLIDVAVQQYMGDSAVYILEGENVLRRLETPSRDDDPFGKDILAQVQATAGANATVSYKIRQSNIYLIVYNNLNEEVEESNSMFFVNYTINMTTYDLEAYQPVCSTLRTTCSVPNPDRGTCLLIQANSERSDHSQVVTVNLRSRRRWLIILVISIAPYLLAMVLAVLFKRATSYRAVGSTGVEDPEHGNNGTHEGNDPENGLPPSIANSKEPTGQSGSIELQPMGPDDTHEEAEPPDDPHNPPLRQ